MKQVSDLPVRELLCRKCRAFITYERIFAGYVLHKCPKCGYENKFEFRFMDVPNNWKMIQSKFTIQPKSDVKGGEKNG